MIAARAALSIAVAAAACSSRHEPSAPPSNTGPLTAAAPATQAPMIDTLRDLARFVSRDPLTVDDVVHRFGRVTADHGAGGSLELTSNDPRVSRVQVWREPSTSAPMLLDLELAPAARPKIAELEAAFGAAKDATPSALGATPKLLFYGVAKGGAFDASLIVRVDRAAGVATGVAIRRYQHVD